MLTAFFFFARKKKVTVLCQLLSPFIVDLYADLIGFVLSFSLHSLISPSFPLITIHYAYPFAENQEEEEYTVDHKVKTLPAQTASCIFFSYCLELYKVHMLKQIRLKIMHPPPPPTSPTRTTTISLFPSVLKSYTVTI